MEDSHIKHHNIDLIHFLNILKLQVLLVALVLRARPSVKLVVEQPSGSWAFKHRFFRWLKETFMLHTVCTWMGMYAHDLPKCSHIVVNFRSALSHCTSKVFPNTIKWGCAPIVRHSRVDASLCRSGKQLRRKMSTQSRKMIRERFERRQEKRAVRKAFWPEQLGSRCWGGIWRGT